MAGPEKILHIPPPSYEQPISFNVLAEREKIGQSLQLIQPVYARSSFL